MWGILKLSTNKIWGHLHPRWDWLVDVAMTTFPRVSKLSALADSSWERKRERKWRAARAKDIRRQEGRFEGCEGKFEEREMTGRELGRGRSKQTLGGRGSIWDERGMEREGCLGGTERDKERGQRYSLWDSKRDGGLHCGHLTFWSEMHYEFSSVGVTS